MSQFLSTIAILLSAGVAEKPAPASVHLYRLQCTMTTSPVRGWPLAGGRLGDAADGSLQEWLVQLRTWRYEVPVPHLGRFREE